MEKKALTRIENKNGKIVYSDFGLNNSPKGEYTHCCVTQQLFNENSEPLFELFYHLYGNEGIIFDSSKITLQMVSLSDLYCGKNTSPKPIKKNKKILVCKEPDKKQIDYYYNHKRVLTEHKLGGECENILYNITGIRSEKLKYTAQKLKQLYKEMQEFKIDAKLYSIKLKVKDKSYINENYDGIAVGLKKKKFTKELIIFFIIQKQKEDLTMNFVYIHWIINLK